MFGGEIGIIVNHIPHIHFTVIECLGHGKAFRRANRRTKATIAAFGHIDIKLGGVQADRRAVGGTTDILHCFDRLNIDTIYRTYLRTLIANNAVVHLIMQTVPAIIRNGNGFQRVLDGDNAILLVIKIG
ncbi:hypothetical protein D3C86_1608510 [compost metagenome]